MRLYLFAPVVLLGWAAHAQSDTTEVQLNAVDVVEYIDVSPQSIELKKAGPMPVNVTAGLNSIAGVNAQAGAANTAKFSYRGFGARSQYTTSRTIMYIDNIPITGLQGFSTFEDVNPLYLNKARLVTPGQASYPAALGGVLHLTTTDADSTKENVHKLYNQFTAGSFGLLANNIWYTNSNQNITVGYENLQQNGWRENSEVSRQSLFFNGKDLVVKNLQFMLYGISSRSEIPSSLSQTDFLNNPERAAKSWAEIEGYEDYEKVISGVSWSNAPKSGNVFNRNIVSVTAFYNYRDGFEPRPFNILKDESHHGGVRATMDRNIKGKVNGNLGAYVELHAGSERARTFQNEFDSVAFTPNKVGPVINSTRLNSQLVYGGLMWQGLFNKNSGWSKWSYKLGVNSYYRNSTSADTSNKMFATPLVLSPLAGVAYSFSGWVQRAELLVYKSSSVPSLEENLDPDGSINTNLKPEEGWTTELLFHAGKGGNSGTLSLYYTQARNLIVPKLIGADQIVATNAGRTIHTGVEYSFTGEKQLAQKSVSRKTWQMYGEWGLTGYYGYFGYQRFSDASNAFDGNRLPGFPEWQTAAYGQFKFENIKAGNSNAHGYQIEIGARAQATGGYFIDDPNTVRNEPYLILQLWGGYEWDISNSWYVNLKAGVNNLLDSRYAGMTVVNVSSFGNAEPRYYYPGEPLSAFASIGLGFVF